MMGHPAAPAGIDDLRRLLRQHGAGPSHQPVLLRAWAQGQDLYAGHPQPAHFFPARLREATARLEGALDDIATPIVEESAADGAVRMVVRLADGETVESVLLPRGGVCVSSQAGCAVGCRFCMTGRDGLRRQLGAAEIVAQVVQARRRQAIRKVVLMGMGEPAHNLASVMEAIDFLGTTGGIGHKNLVFSTVGDERAFAALPLAAVKPALALSLHSTFGERRAALLPRAPRIDPAQLVARAEAYARATGYPVQVQWTLLEGVNDGDDELAGIIDLLAGKHAVVNFIPFNAGPGLAFRRPSWERAVELTRALLARGILAKLRQSAGQDIDGGCGQLRRRAAGDDSTRAAALPPQAAGCRSASWASQDPASRKASAEPSARVRT